MERTLSPLPYAKDALEPYVTGLTLEIHYERHHRGYLEKLLDLVEGKPEQDEPLEKLVRTATGDLYDYAAQVWNHEFYWRSLRPGGSRPNGALLACIERDFGGFDELKRRFAQVATSHFGSGWAWLVLDGRRLRVVSTSDAGNPMREGGFPLLTVDLWEHAYYLDYFNERQHYVHNTIDHLLDWDFAAENLRRVTAEWESERPACPSADDDSSWNDPQQRDPEPDAPTRDRGDEAGARASF